MDNILQGLTGKDPVRDVKLMTCKDPVDVDLPEIQLVLRHLYLDEVSRLSTYRARKAPKYFGQWHRHGIGAYVG